MNVFQTEIKKVVRSSVRVKSVGVSDRRVIETKTTDFDRICRANESSPKFTENTQLQ